MLFVPTQTVIIKEIACFENILRTTKVNILFYLAWNLILTHKVRKKSSHTSWSLCYFHDTEMSIKLLWFQPQHGQHFVWQKSLWQALCVIHQWANSLCGKAASCLESMLCQVLVWESQKTWVGELVDVIWQKYCWKWH